MALLATPVKSEERRKQAAFGSPFLWILSFGEVKESISPSGARTRFKNRRVSNFQINTNFKTIQPDSLYQRREKSVVYTCPKKV